MFKDVLARTDLTMAPVIALVCFFAIFVGIGLWLVLSKNSAHFEHMNDLPLHDGVTAEGAGVLDAAGVRGAKIPDNGHSGTSNQGGHDHE